jgi:hypothetical protein
MSNTELIYRMRTCAAALASNGEPPLVLLRDAADLLVEASNELDVPEPLGDPMELLERAGKEAYSGGAVWGGQLPPVQAQPCPSCGSIDARKVRRAGRKLMLTCPACEHEWEYGRAS